MIESRHILEFLPLVLGALLLLGGLLVYIAFKNAPEGSEDDTGFHTS